MKTETTSPKLRFGFGVLLAVGLMLPATANAQREDVVVAPSPNEPAEVDPVRPDIEPPNHPSPYAGGYRLSINDTRGPKDCLTYAVGWMRVLRDGTFVLWARNPEHGGSATVTGEVLRNGKLVFSPPPPPNIRAHVKIGRNGRCITKLFGRYLVVTPATDPADDSGDDNADDAGDDAADGAADDAEPTLGVVRDHRKKKAGVVIGFRR